MRKLKAFLSVLLLCSSLQAQNSISFRVLDAESSEPLIGATIYVSENIGAIANDQGIATLNNLNAESIKVRFSFIGYETQTRTFSLPYVGNSPIVILMEHDEESMEDVVVTATRSSRSIEDIPTRVEFLGSEELEEKAVMRSANIAMLLRESTGIQMQVTSPSTANQSIRIQGLDGRYTQLMKDGFPLYGGFSGGLSIMQIPPLDLRQVEVIKGSNSTLYGGGAIAGLVNLVSLRPGDEKLTKLMFDQTSAGGTTVNVFHASEDKKWSYTLFASGNRQQAFDANGDDFSDLPESRTFTFNPTLFFKPDISSQFRLALNGTFENRWGGELMAIDSREASVNDYLLDNTTRRMSYQLSYNKDLDNKQKLSIKNSYLHFDRDIARYQYQFDGKQSATFSEAAYSFGETSSRWIIGVNLYSDRFNEGTISSNDRSYDQVTFGGFIQQNTQFNEKWFLETGVRLDGNKDFGTFFLPRLSLLYKASRKISFRAGGGFGYKLPTIFTEDTERLAFQDLESFNLTNLDGERSYGANFDINYKTELGSDWTLSLNQLFYWTELNDPLILNGPSIEGTYAFRNAMGDLRSMGLESNLKLTYKDFKLFFNYALIDTEQSFQNDQQKPLTPKHNIGTVLVYEEHGKWRIGLEAYYAGEQFRSDYTVTDDYWLAGVMLLRKFKNISFYLNFENLTDTRQSRFETINLSTAQNPESLEVWAPMDGFITNGGVIFEF